MKTVNIYKDFSEYPKLRHCSLSDTSGEQFYHQILNKAFKEALEKDEQIVLNLDNTAGYASSFLDEAFGNLVYDFSLNMVKDRLIIISNDEPEWKDMIQNETYKQWEERRNKSLKPKVTAEHQSWYRLVNKEIKSGVWEHPI